MLEPATNDPANTADSAQNASPESAKRDSAPEVPTMRKQVRGSTLLLAGRGFAIILNLLTQVIIVRTLIKSDFGHFAYAMSLVELFSVICVFCMDKAFARVGAIQHERRDQQRFAGVLLLSLLTPLLLGGVLATGIMWGGRPVARLLSLDDATRPLLFVLAMLIPLNGVGSVVQSLMAVARGPRDVFLRRHVLGPSLKLLVVGGVAIAGGNVVELTQVWLATGVIGVCADLWLIKRIASEEKLWPYVRLSAVVPVWIEVIRTCLPQVVSDVAMLARSTLTLVLLGWMSSSVDTAAFRAALSLAKANELVIVNFCVLFIPIASRLYAQGSTEVLWNTLRQTSLWITLLSFPVFAFTVTLAAPVTMLLFGADYVDSGRLLVILAFGYFLQAAYGFHGQVLRVTEHFRLMILIEIFSAVVTLLLAGVCIWAWNGLGAAAAVTTGMLVQSLLKAWGAASVAPNHPRDEFRVIRWVTTLIAVGLVFIALVRSPGWLTGLLLASVASLAVWLVCRSSLNLSEMFPEFQRLKEKFMGRSLRHENASHGNDSPTGTRPLRLAYMMSRFPKLTETFVLREIVEMTRLGADVRVYPLQRERAKVVHPEAVEFVNRACFTPWVSPAIIGANLRVGVRQPLRYLGVLWTLLRANFGSPRFLSGALLFFPKIVYLGDQMQRAQVDHLHAHFASHPAMAAWVIHQLFGIPYSFTAHGSDLHCDRHMLREKVAEAAAAITISDYNRRMIVDECSSLSPTAVRDAIAAKVHVIHCGIDTGVFPPRSQPTPFDRGEGPFRMICIGTLHEVKGQSYLLQACAMLRDRGIDFRCCLVGDGPDHRTLVRLTEELGLGKLVEFAGKRTSAEIQSLLQVSDVIVAPSVLTKDGRREGIPVALMEGMACRLAAVASDLSGIPELVRHQQTGLLVPPRDAKLLAQAFAELATDHEQRHRLADAGYELIQQEFLVANNTALLLKIILHAAANETGERGGVSPPVLRQTTHRGADAAPLPCFNSNRVDPNAAVVEVPKADVSVGFVKMEVGCLR